MLVSVILRAAQLSFVREIGAKIAMPAAAEGVKS